MAEKIGSATTCQAVYNSPLLFTHSFILWARTIARPARTGAYGTHTTQTRPRPDLAPTRRPGPQTDAHPQRPGRSDPTPTKHVSKAFEGLNPRVGFNISRGRLGAAKRFKPLTLDGSSSKPSTKQASEWHRRHAQTRLGRARIWRHNGLGSVDERASRASGASGGKQLGRLERGPEALQQGLAARGPRPASRRRRPPHRSSRT